MRSEKLNKKKKNIKIVLILISILLLVAIYTLARYAEIKQDTHIQQTVEFYFNSSILKESNPVYYKKDWDGQGTYTIPIDLNNYEDTLRKTNIPINYTVSAQTNNTSVVASVSEQTGTINANESTKTINVNLSLNNNAVLADGQSIEVVVQVNSTSPYAKQLSATFNVCKTSYAEYTANIIDEANNEYAVLSITTKEIVRPIILSYDTTKSTLDTTNTLFNNVSITNNSSITLNLESNKNYNIEFIKKIPANVLALGTDITVA